MVGGEILLCYLWGPRMFTLTLIQTQFLPCLAVPLLNLSWPIFATLPHSHTCLCLKPHIHSLSISGEIPLHQRKWHHFPVVPRKMIHPLQSAYTHIKFRTQYFSISICYPVYPNETVVLNFIFKTKNECTNYIPIGVYGSMLCNHLSMWCQSISRVLVVLVAKYCRDILWIKC